MAQGHKGACLAPPGGHTLGLGGEGGLRGFRRHVGRFHQHLASPSTALTGLPAQALASTLLMAWAPPRPGGQRLGTWEAAQVWANCGHQDLGWALANPRARLPKGHRLLLGHEGRRDHRTDAVDRVIAVVDLAEVLGEQEAVGGVN
jgi:hypothetical protein